MRTHLPMMLLAALLTLPVAAAAETVIVEMRTVDSYPVFVPAEVSIEPGDTVRWINLDLQTEHATCSGGGSADPTYGDLWQSPLLRYGEFYEFTFVEADDYEYFSLPHEYEGMLGLVRVGSSTDTPPMEITTWGRVKTKFADILPRD